MSLLPFYLNQVNVPCVAAGPEIKLIKQCGKERKTVQKHDKSVNTAVNGVNTAVYTL